jgi:hypothetical protein
MKVFNLKSVGKNYEHKCRNLVKLLHTSSSIILMKKNMSKDKCIIENKTNFNNGMDGKGVFFVLHIDRQRSCKKVDVLYFLAINVLWKRKNPIANEKKCCFAFFVHWAAEIFWNWTFIFYHFFGVDKNQI